MREERGLADVMGAHFDRVTPEARELYAERQQALTPEQLRNERDGIGRILPPPAPATLDVTARVGY